MQQGPLVLVVGIAILNGLFSPALILVFAFAGLWYPWFMPASMAFVFFFSSLIVATFTLMIAGVPAAIYERLSGQESSTYVSMGIWLFAELLLTAPAVVRMLAGTGG